jgi:hypothetical protein
MSAFLSCRPFIVQQFAFFKIRHFIVQQFGSRQFDFRQKRSTLENLFTYNSVLILNGQSNRPFLI